MVDSAPPSRRSSSAARRTMGFAGSKIVLFLPPGSRDRHDGGAEFDGSGAPADGEARTVMIVECRGFDSPLPQGCSSGGRASRC